MILSCFNLFVIFVTHIVADFDKDPPSDCVASGLHDDLVFIRDESNMWTCSVMLYQVAGMLDACFV